MHKENHALVRVLGVAAIFGCLSFADAEGIDCSAPSENTNFGRWSDLPLDNYQLTSDNSTKSIGVGPRSRYARLVITRSENLNEDASTGSKNWALTVSDNVGRVVETFTKDSFLSGGNVAISNRILIEDSAPKKLYANLFGAETDFSVSIGGLILMPSAPQKTYYSRQKQGESNWSGLNQRKNKAFHQHGKNTALLIVAPVANADPIVCSGIAIPPNFLLTNWHCSEVRNNAGEIVASGYWTDDICKNRVLIDTSWDGDQVSRDFVCSNVLAYSRDLDYALLEITPKNAVDIILPVSLSSSILGDDIYVIHHPAGDQKSITLDCKITNRDLESVRGETASARFGHNCDTEGGSSGAPIYSRHSGAIVGIHHQGFDEAKTDECGKINKAVWMSSIMKDLEESLLSNRESTKLSHEQFLQILQLFELPVETK